MKTSNLLKNLIVFPIIAFGLAGKMQAQDTTSASQDTSAKITGNFTSDIKSDYVAFGYILGEGPHKQDYLGLNYKNLNTFFWSDYDFGSKQLMEIDIGAGYSKEFNENLSMSTGFTYLHYPAGDDDNVLNVKINHKKKLDKKLNIIYFIEDKEISNGFVFQGEISKNFEIAKNLSSTISLSGTYANNFYKDTGISNITSGANLNYSKDNVSLTGFINYQLGFIENPAMLPPAKNQLYGGFGLSVDF